MKTTFSMLSLSTVLIFTLAVSCSCSETGNGTNSETDSVTFTDTGSESGTEIENDNGTVDNDSETASVSDVGSETDDGTDTDTSGWNWASLPEGEDCGGGCRQLTFTEGVRSVEWDVWEDKLVFNDVQTQVWVVDFRNSRQSKIPIVHPGLNTGLKEPYSHVYPAIYNQKIVFGGFYKAGPKNRFEMVYANISSDEVVVLNSLKLSDGNNFAPSYVDVYGENVVSMGGCGDVEHGELCHFELPPSGSGKVLIEGDYGSHNSVWGDRVVWSTGGLNFDIHGYDFQKKEVFEVTSDEEYQFAARIYEDKVVYTDLRHGEGQPFGVWINGAVYLKNLTTGQEQLIAGGDALASMPDIFGDIVVWMDHRDCADSDNQENFWCAQVWGKNLKTGVMAQITDIEQQKGDPRIWGERVFVHMQRKDKGDSIYMFELPETLKTK